MLFTGMLWGQLIGIFCTIDFVSASMDMLLALGRPGRTAAQAILGRHAVRGRTTEGASPCGTMRFGGLDRKDGSFV